MISFSMGIGGSFMSKCPFWSMKKESVHCYDECPMKSEASDGESCLFKEVSDEPKVVYKEIISENFEYAEEKNGEYDFLKKMGSY